MPSGAASGTRAGITYYDAGNEPGNFRMFGFDLTAATFDAEQALWTAVMDACDALVLGAKAKSYYGNDLIYLWSQPTNGAAREIALLIQGTDNTTGQRLTLKLPTIDPTIPHYVENINAKDVVLLTEPTEITDLIDALNNFWINPYTGHQMTVVGLKVVRGGK